MTNYKSNSCPPAGRQNSNKQVTILGIDPGTALTGWGVLKNNGKIKFKTVGFGCVVTKAGVEMGQRLITIYKETSKIMDEYKPSSIALERLFFNTNIKTAISVGQARGVVMLAAAERNINVFEYTALQAKLIITGYGRAKKKEMQQKVGDFLKIKEKIKPDDVADALAMAICHIEKYEKGTF